MKPGSSILIVSSLLIAACGTPATVATPAPGPAPRPTTNTAPRRPNPAPTASPSTSAPSSVAPPVKLSEAPRDWQLLDETTDHVPGIGAKRAMAELLGNRAPGRTVVVAVIDGGVDTSHADLRANLWTNPKEVPGNGKDDDGNGYVDDVHGWDFIGGSDGKDVHFDTFEVTREYARCHGKAAASGAPPLTDAATCAGIDSAFNAKRGDTQRLVASYRQAATVMHQIVPLLQQAIGGDSLSLSAVRAFRPASDQLARARAIYIDLVSQGATPKALDDGVESIDGQLKYGLNPDFDPRSIVGDRYTDPTERHYGNADVTGPDANHGTHVSGIIGAVRGNGLGVDGIAPAVKIMAIRAVPDGDERDKDIANAIRYAVDNGAQIISMSFGKPYSPYKSAVDDAVRYADQKGVLMVHAAGNDGADIGSAPNFPSPAYQDGSRPRLWIEVGASSWKGGDSLAAKFSNYSRKDVSVFAPGVDVLSTVPGNDYARESGTSMAAPVVSGLAALIMSYYPNLTAADVKEVILESATRYSDQQVLRPTGEDVQMKVPFGSLSATGGIVNAYNAIKLLQQREAGATP